MGPRPSCLRGTWSRRSTRRWIGSATTWPSATRRGRRSSPGRSSGTPCTGSPADWPSSEWRGATPSRSCSATAGSSSRRDLAAVSLGAIPFSIYQTYAPEQIQYLLSDAESKLVITEQAYLDNVSEARKGVSTLENVIVVDGEGGDLTLDELMEMDPEFDPAESVEQLGPDDLLTLIYTSGTTGPPKGVQLTHRNLLFAIATADEMIQLPERGGKVISWLPAAHVAERNAHYYLPMTRGLAVHVCADPRRIAEYLPEGEPDLVLRRPADLREAQVRARGDDGRACPTSSASLVQKGLEASLQKVRLEQAGEEVPCGDRRGRRPGGRADVLAAAQAARPRRGAGGQRRRRPDPARGPRVLPRDRHPDRRALGDVGDLRTRAPSTRRTGSSSARSDPRHPGSRSASTTTARS